MFLKSNYTKRILIFFLSIAPFFGYGQDYLPTLGEGKEWELNIVDVESQTYPAYYYTACDTLLNGLTYKSIIRKSNGEVIAYTREDLQNQEVYYLPLDLSPEILVLDYSLEAGDTFVLRGYPIVVQSVTAETIFGQERTIIHFPAGIKFIEGVGHNQYGVLNWVLEGFYNSVTWIKENQATCEQITTTLKLSYGQLFIYPNPVTEELIIDSGESELFNLPISLYSPQGLLLKKWVYQNDPIAMSQFMSGVYYLKIANRTFKVIKI